VGVLLKNEKVEDCTLHSWQRVNEGQQFLVGQFADAMCVMIYSHIVGGLPQSHVSWPLPAEIVSYCMNSYPAHPTLESSLKAVLIEACENPVEGIAVNFLRYTIISRVAADDAKYQRSIHVIQFSLGCRLTPAASSNKLPQPIRSGFRGC
jgi:hypothetical protein